MDKKISELDSGSPPLPSDQIPVARAGDNYRLTLAEIGLVVSVKAYGAVGNGVADDTAAIQAAIAAAALVHGVVFFPPGIYCFSSTLTISSRISLIGSGRGDASGVAAAGTILKKTADVVGIQIASGANFTELRDFTLTTDLVGGGTDGIRVGEADHTNGSGHCVLVGLYVSKQGGNGINVLNGNIGRIDQVYSYANQGHGLCIDSQQLDGGNTNGWVITNLSAIGNNGDGLHLGIASSHQVHGFDAEGNNGYGLYLGSTYNFVSGYIEANTAGPFSIGASAFSNHCWLRIVGTSIGTIANFSNYIHSMSEKAGYQPPTLIENGSLAVHAAISCGAFNSSVVAGHVFIGASSGNIDNVTPANANDFQIDNPSGLVVACQFLTIRVKNATGGALGTITWDSLYQLAAAWVNPATGYSRWVTFAFTGDGNKWFEVCRSSGDVPN